MTELPDSSNQADHAATTTVTVRTGSEQETMEIASRIAEALRPGDLITLDGPLGSGKTCFVRGLAQAMGIDPMQVSSPTFIIRQEYVSSAGSALTHIDGYRIGGVEELESIGWDELLETGASIVAIEWPSRIGAALTGHVTLVVTFEHCSPTGRALTFEISDKDRPRFERIIGDG